MSRPAGRSDSTMRGAHGIRMSGICGCRNRIYKKNAMTTIYHETALIRKCVSPKPSNVEIPIRVRYLLSDFHAFC